MVAIAFAPLADDLSLRGSVRPEVVDFIRAPDGTFVGE